MRRGEDFQDVEISFGPPFLHSIVNSWHSGHPSPFTAVLGSNRRKPISDSEWMRCCGTTRSMMDFKRGKVERLLNFGIFNSILAPTEGEKRVTRRQFGAMDLVNLGDEAVWKHVYLNQPEPSLLTKRLRPPIPHNRRKLPLLPLRPPQRD